MTVTALLHKKSARAKNFRNRFILLCVLTPVLAAVCVLLGVFTAPSNPVFIAVLVLSCVFVAVGTAYCCAEYASVKRFYALCSDAAFPCVVVTERRNLEFFEAEADDVRRYAELELKLNLALYKEQGRQGARVVSDAERKALKAQERELAATIGRAYAYADFTAEDAPLLKNKTVFVSESMYGICARSLHWKALEENGSTVVQLKNPNIAK